MNDKQFMTVLLGVTGVILIIFFMIFFIAQMIAPVSKKTDEFTNNAVVQRIEPVGKLNYAGSGSSARRAAAAAARVARRYRSCAVGRASEARTGACAGSRVG